MDTPLEQLPAEAVPPGVTLLAEVISEADARPAVVTRVGVVTAVEATGSRRVQCDIGGSTWLSRIQDAAIAVGDRVSVLQQDSVMLVIGRLSGVDVAAPVGAIMPYAGASAPAGWLLANGAAVSRTTYAALYAVVGTTYGVGNGSTTFNVPNLQNSVPVGSGDDYARAATGGTATVTLSSSNIPSHTHSFSDTSTSDGSHGHSVSVTVDYVAAHAHYVAGQGYVAGLQYGGAGIAASTASGVTGDGGYHNHGASGTANSGGSHTHDVSGTTGSTGSGGSHENMPPYIAMPYIIRAL